MLPVVLRTDMQASGGNGNPRPVMREKTIDPSACGKKVDTDWRIVSININKFPTEKDGHDKAKLDLLRETIHASGADIIGISEMGRNENNLPFQKRPSWILDRFMESETSLQFGRTRGSPRVDKGSMYCSHYKKGKGRKEFRKVGLDDCKREAKLYHHYNYNLPSKQCPSDSPKSAWAHMKNQLP